MHYKVKVLKVFKNLSVSLFSKTMAYAILLFLWIILPKLSAPNFAQNPFVMENHFWQVAFALPMCLYYCKIFRFGFLKKMYEVRSEIFISALWIVLFGFLKISEISFKSSVLQNADFTVKFDEFFDLAFAVSFPLAIICKHAHAAFFKSYPVHHRQVKPAVKATAQTTAQALPQMAIAGEKD